MPPQPRFPAEILDHIIYDALANHCVSTPATLSSYALVSRLWRARTNGHRFRAVGIFIDDDTTAELQALAEICTSKVWLAHESVSRDVQHCTLIRGSRPLNNFDMFERSAERDAAVVAVLRSIFRHRAERSHSQGIARTVGLSVYAGNYSTGASRGFYFQTLGPNIVSALDDLVREANLEHLELDRVWDVPWRFVAQPTLTRLQLKCVSFLRPDDASTELVSSLRGCILPKLDDICLEYSPSFMTILSAERYTTPPPVTKMCIAYECTRQEQIDYDSVYHLGSQLDSLGLEFIGGERYSFQICYGMRFSRDTTRRLHQSVPSNRLQQDPRSELLIFETAGQHQSRQGLRTRSDTYSRVRKRRAITAIFASE